MKSIFIGILESNIDYETHLKDIEYVGYNFDKAKESVSQRKYAGTESCYGYVHEYRKEKLIKETQVFEY